MTSELKSLQKFTQFKELFSNFFILTLFCICLVPFSIALNGTGITANYFYVFFPFLFLMPFIRRKLIYHQEIAIIICVFIAIYFLHTPFELFDSEAKIFRRFGSFLFFIFPLTLAFIKFERHDLHLFKLAVLIVCLYYSFSKLLLFSTLTLGYDGYFNWIQGPEGLENFWGANIRDIKVVNLKGIIGSQRYGFLLIFALWISLFEPKLFFKKGLIFQRILISVVLFVSCFLTFSRATLLVLILTGIFYFVYKFSEVWNFFLKKTYHYSISNKLLTMIVIITIISLIFGFIYFFRDLAILSFYKARFIEPFMSGSQNFTNPESSEGYRIMLFAHVFEYVSQHPFYGSSYRGISQLYNHFNNVGSVHNQYLDVFLRVGIIGTFFWLFLLYRIFEFCKKDTGLLIGFVGILFYGLFHETFRMSYGSFIFGMLLSFSYSSYLDNKRKKIKNL
tara:strand:+ start:450 stop:1793 length:1344 start_codon:yes stop_codon:yes gene_type:complete